MLPEPRGPAPHVRPLGPRRRPRCVAATAACGRPRWAKLSPNVADLAEIAAAAARRAPRRSRWSTPCSGMAIDVDDAPAGARWRRRRVCRARPSTRSPCGPCYDVHAACPGLPDRRRRRRPRGDRRRRAAARRRASAVQVGTATFADPRAPATGAATGAGRAHGAGADRRSRRAVRASCVGGAHDAEEAERRRPPRDDPRRASPSPSTSTTSSRRMRLARLLPPWFGVAKVGLELYSAAGPEADRARCRAARLRGLLRPQAARHPDHGAAARRGCSAPSARPTSPSTPPAASRCCAPVSRGCAAGARPAGCPSAGRAGRHGAHQRRRTRPAHVFAHRVRPAVEAGCGGLVCAAAEVADAKRLAPRLLAVVPGIRPAGDAGPRPGPGGHTGRGDRRRRRPPRHRPGRHRRAADPAAAAAVAGRPRSTSAAGCPGSAQALPR